MKKRLISMAMAFGVSLAGQAYAAQPIETIKSPTLKTVLTRGALNCSGHNGSYLGFAEIDDKGNWKGMDIDLCRAVATAIFGSPDKLKIIPISWVQRWPALQGGDIDILIKISAGTLSRDTELGFQFSIPYFLAGTKILAHKKLGITELKEANGGTVCTLAGSVQEKLIANHARRIGIKLQNVTLEKSEELQEAYFSGRCDLFVEFGPTLAITRMKAAKPDDHVLLKDNMAVSPEVMIVRQNDDAWLDIANWVISVLLFAEQEGITSKNVDAMKAAPPSPEIAKLLGARPGMGKALGLDDTWAYNVIKHVGNYAELYDRNVGTGSPYKMPRELNDLWQNGGVLYPYVID